MVTARWSRSPTRSPSPSPGQAGSSSAPCTATTTAAPTYVPGWSRHSSASATLPNRRPRRTAPGPNQRSLQRWRPVDLVPAEQPLPGGPPERLMPGGAQPLFVRAHRVPNLLDTMNRHEVHRHASRPRSTRSPPTGVVPIADASRVRNADPAAACTSPAATAILAPTDPETQQCGVVVLEQARRARTARCPVTSLSIGSGVRPPRTTRCPGGWIRGIKTQDQHNEDMTTAADDHRHIAASFTDRVNNVLTTGWDAPAPVQGWVARDVVRHLVTWLPPFLHSGAGITLPPGPSVDDDPAAAWAAHTKAVQAVLDDPANESAILSNPHIGDMPLSAAIANIYTADVFMHTWDLARATGQDDSLDATRCEMMYQGMQPLDDVLRSSGQYGPRVPVADEADAQTRLLGFIGRNPTWQPTTIA